jgi:transposase
VSVVNPLRIKAYGQSRLIRNKTDKLDAFLIADFCLSQKPPLWSPPEPAVREVQELVRHLEDLQSMYQMERNRLKSGVRSLLVIDNLKQHIVYLEKQIKDVKISIQVHINQNRELKHQQCLLVTIPGIGKLTAAKLLGEIKNIHSFESAPQLAAYAGVTPRQRRSGSSVRGKSRFVKTGNANLRKALFMPALVAKKHNPIISAFCKRLEKRGKKPIVIVGAAMRKLLHISYGVLKSGKAFDPNYLNDLQFAS